MIKRTVLLSLGVYLLGFLGALPDPFASPIWPATGFQIAMYFRFGPRAIWMMTPGILAIQLQLGFQGGMSIYGAVMFAVFSWTAMATEAWLAVKLTNLGKNGFNGQSSYLRFALIGAPIGTLISAIQGVTVLWLFNAYPTSIEWYIPYLVWWTGNLIGAYTIVPLLMLKRVEFHIEKNQLSSIISQMAISWSLVVALALNPYPYLHQFILLSIIISLYFLIRSQHYAMMILTLSVGVLAYIVLDINDLVVLNIGNNGNIYDLFTLEGVLAVTLSLTTIFFHQLKEKEELAIKVSEDNLSLRSKVEARTQDLIKEMDEKQQAEDRLKESHRILKCIDALRNDFIQQKDPYELFPQFLDRLLTLTQSKFGFVADYIHNDNDDPYLKMYAISNLAWDDDTQALYDSLQNDAFEFRKLDNFIGRAVTHRQVVIANDLKEHNKFPSGHPQLENFIGIPVFFGNELVGQVGLADRTNGYNEKFVQWLKPVTQTLAQIIHARWSLEAKQQAEDEIHRLAITDSLTGLANRRQLNLHLERQSKMAMRYHESFSLLMLDLDHFKLINDQFGHKVGDYVLVEFSQTVNSELRNADLMARWGGEEFVVLLPNTNEEIAIELANRILVTIADHNFDHIEKLTVSIGVVEFNPKESLSQAFDRLDKRLYEAKNSGRNKVVPALHSSNQPGVV